MKQNKEHMCFIGQSQLNIIICGTTFRQTMLELTGLFANIAMQSVRKLLSKVNKHEKHFQTLS